MVSSYEGVRRAHDRAQQQTPPSSTGRSDVPSVRVLVVDDHEAFRDAMQALVAATPGFVLVGQASSGEDALDQCARLSPQLVLMDVVMPGIGGIAAARSIVSRHPDVAIVLLSVDDPAAQLGGEQLGKGVALLRKQQLTADELRHTWDRLRNWPS